MRAIWTGAISFGLVNIPVRLYSAVGSNSLDFDMLSKKDLAPIRYSRVSSADGKEVAYKDIVKGYEIEKGNYVVLEKKDFESAAPERTRTIEIMDFVMEAEIDTIYFEKPYYIEPDKNAVKPYALLREALKQSKKVGVARFVLRNRENLAILKVSGDVIILQQMRFEADIRDAQDLNLPAASTVNKKEIDTALKLIDQLTEKFDASQFKDSYTEQLKKIIEAKAKGKPISVKSKEAAPTKVKDLMDTLIASIEASKKKTNVVAKESRPPVKRTIKKAVKQKK
jgi:DNA end-binding protein Ku